MIINVLRLLKFIIRKSFSVERAAILSNESYPSCGAFTCVCVPVHLLRRVKVCIVEGPLLKCIHTPGGLYVP